VYKNFVDNSALNLLRRSFKNGNTFNLKDTNAWNGIIHPGGAHILKEVLNIGLPR